MYGRRYSVSTVIMDDLLRSLPSIERLLARPLAERLSEDLSRERVRDLLREITGRLRVELIDFKSQISNLKSLCE
jgi:hypothetical protein